MALQVVNNAICKCSFGAAPSSLGVLPTNRVFGCDQPAANIMDNVPFVNVRPFGMCTSMGNPAVAAATAAALGALTPQACTPNPTGPWAAGAPTVLLADKPTLDDTSTLTCAYGGIITITFAGQSTVFVP